nr:threonine--tRNA ligase [Candidatus Njordarchaeota archaeon]
MPAKGKGTDAVELTFPDGSKKKYRKGITPPEVANDIGLRLAADAIAAKLDGVPVDLNSPIEKDSKFEVLTFDSKEGKEVLRHSAAHILAHAVTELYPEALPTIGPAVEDGFYYDFDMEPVSSDDLKKIEAKMNEIIKADLLFKKIIVPKNQALELFKANKFKVELVGEFGGDQVTVYEQGEFKDFCRGPHALSTGKVGAVKLTKVAGAYWRGDANNPQLQRIYGVAFPTEKMLKDYIHMIEEAEKRDHRKLGQELELFSLHEEGPGMPFFLPKGLALKNKLIELLREEYKKRGYVEVSTPQILSTNLWKRSGHLESFKENMFFTEIEGADYALKPMNCPGAILIYKEKKHSYRELPLRMAEFGIVHRYELSGTLSGLLRVRFFTQDDAHIFLAPELIRDEIIELIDFVDSIYKIFGFEFRVELSTKPEKSIGSDEAWEIATKGLRDALEYKKMKYKLNPGEGAFYGPKVDFHIKDAIGRTWQCATIQLDMNLPERFDLTYIGEDSKEHRCVMIHRVILGSLERFMGILIEHYAGKLPLWLNPVQVVVINVADRHGNACMNVKEQLDKNGIRVSADLRSETVEAKIRDAHLQKINYILVVGDREVKDNTVTVRTRDNVVLGAMKIEDFIEKLNHEVKERK